MDTFQSYNILIFSILLILIGKFLKNRMIVWLSMLSFLLFSIINIYIMVHRKMTFNDPFSFNNYSIIANYSLSIFSLIFIYILYRQMNY